MSVPRGLRRPIDIVELIPPVVIFLGVCFLSARAFLDLAQMPPA